MTLPLILSWPATYAYDIPQDYTTDWNSMNQLTLILIQGQGLKFKVKVDFTQIWANISDPI